MPRALLGGLGSRVRTAAYESYSLVNCGGKGRTATRRSTGATFDPPNWRATLAGDENVTEVRSAIAALGLCGRVHIPGYWIGPAEVEDLITHADVLVLPSFNEGLPMSVIEGMAGGLAVVTTPVGAVRDVIEHEKTGLLVPPGDVPALAKAMQRLIEDPGLRERLGREAKRFHQANLEISSYARHLSQIWWEVAREFSDAPDVDR